MPISMLFWPNWTRKYSNTCTLLQLFSVYGAIKGNQTSIFSFQKYICVRILFDMFDTCGPYSGIVASEPLVLG